MGWIRQALWVPMVFGILMGGLALANMYAKGFGVVFVAAPAEIFGAYRAASQYISNSIFFLFDFRLNSSAIDIAAFYLVCSFSNMRHLLLRWYLIPEDQRHRFELSNYSYRQGNFIDYLIYFSLGPILVFIKMLDVRDALRNIRRFNSSKFDNDILPIFKTRFRIDLRLLILLLLLIIANALVSFVMLWWNAAEIERLTTGIL